VNGGIDMQSTALRIHGKKDLRVETIELPEIQDDEILATVVSDTMCMSSWKLAMEGEEHKKTPDDLDHHPAMVGHEFAGKILKVGKKWQSQFHEGQDYVIQPNLARDDTPFVPGYSYPYIGGDATHIIIPNEVMALGCLIPFEGEAYYEGSLCEPVSCIIAAFHAHYHVDAHSYQPTMGVKVGGDMLIMGGTGPMGLLAVDYALHGPMKPKTLIVTDVDQAKLDRAKRLYPSDDVDIQFVNVDGLSLDEQRTKLSSFVGGKGFDDIFLMISVSPLVTLADSLLNPDGCLDQFAGPMTKDFTAQVNFYNVHYNFTHYVGTSGGSADNEAEAAQLIADKKLDVSKVITHVMGLNDAGETTMDQPAIGGGKKLVYSGKKFDRIELAKVDPSSALGQILARHDGLWSKEAEQWILANMPDIA
jgi:threonine dehydrogenase-like Zn-dependent dehydrogenase